MLNLCLVRHGETAWNADARIQGQLDIPLNDAGLAQARAVALALAAEVFDAAYSSDLARARQTAECLLGSRPLGLVADERLRERHYGHFQQLTYAQARSEHAEEFAYFARRELDRPLAGGETLREFAARVEAALDDIARRHPAGKVLVVTHGGVLDIAYRRATGRDLRSARDFALPNAAINRIAVTGGRWSLVSWGEEAHLARARDELA